MKNKKSCQIKLVKQQTSAVVSFLFVVCIKLSWLPPPSSLLSRRQSEGGADEGLVGAELLLQRQEEEVQRLQAHLASRLSRVNLYPTDDPLGPPHPSMLDIQDPLYASSVPLRKARVCALHRFKVVLEGVFAGLCFSYKSFLYHYILHKHTHDTLKKAI